MHCTRKDREAAQALATVAFETVVDLAGELASSLPLPLSALVGLLRRGSSSSELSSRRACRARTAGCASPPPPPSCRRARPAPRR